MVADSRKAFPPDKWNMTQRDFPAARCIHQLFEAQVKREPHAPALLFEDNLLSYAELNRRSNKLAHYLKQLQVGPEIIVGLCLNRGLEFIIGMLGVFKAGGAYLPLDPTYPMPRLSFIKHILVCMTDNTA